MTRENETRILGMIQNNGLSRHIYQDSQGNFKDASTFALVPVPSLSSWASPTQNADPCTLVLLLEQDLKLNSIYEFVGFYESQQDEQLLFIASEFIPVSLPDSDNFIQVQKDLRDATTALLFGDDIAADYLLSQLFSTRVSQQTQKFHLNISNFPQDSQFLSKFYQDLVPISKYIPQTIESLNKLIYCPTMDNGGSTTAQQVEKEYDTLNQGELQLPDYSIVILDEFTMNDGTLFERGLRNVQSVVDILKYGELNYGIAFGSFAVKCNVSVLVTSIGKSMFPIDVSVPLEIRQDSDTPDLDVLIKSRGFVSAMSSRWQEYVIPDSLTERITEEFANRKTGDLFRQKATAIDLAYILDIARGLTLMGGELELTDRVLERACLMERVRFDRIEAMKKVAE